MRRRASVRLRRSVSVHPCGCVFACRSLRRTSRSGLGRKQQRKWTLASRREPDFGCTLCRAFYRQSRACCCARSSQRGRRSGVRGPPWRTGLLSLSAPQDGAARWSSAASLRWKAPCPLRSAPRTKIPHASARRSPPKGALHGRTGKELVRQSRRAVGGAALIWPHAASKTASMALPINREHVTVDNASLARLTMAARNGYGPWRGVQHLSIRATLVMWCWAPLATPLWLEDSERAEYLPPPPSTSNAEARRRNTDQSLRQCGGAAANDAAECGALDREWLPTPTHARHHSFSRPEPAHAPKSRRASIIIAIASVWSGARSNTHPEGCSARSLHADAPPCSLSRN
jgi:hypothetical protein